MLARKIENTLLKWKQAQGHNPLVIMGIRQCGKTFIAMEFANSNYEHVVYINFIKQPERIMAFNGSKDVENILLNLSSQMPNARFVPNKTCIILDEIQDCPDARTSLKFFKEDGRFDVIATGSLLGISGYGEKQKKAKKQQEDILLGKNSVPVGYETIIEMYPLDFEEFLWANGISSEVIDALKRCFQSESPVPEGIHVAMKNLLYRYIAVGGLPSAVNKLLETNNMGEVDKVLKSIIREYKDDMVKYASDDDKPRIRECFESVPRQLSKENKKFQFSNVKPGGRSSMYLGSLQWLEDAGIVQRCYNTEITELPLEGNAIDNVFKVYVTDIGILITMLGASTRADILQGNLGGFKGAIFENLMAETLHKKQQNLYYYHKDSGLELDFLIRYGNQCVPVEVKANSTQAKSLSTVMKHPEKYHISQAFKFGNYNIGRENGVLTLPTYMQFLLNLEPKEMQLELFNANAINQLAATFLHSQGND